jgi:hypothetical protein
MRDKLAIAAGQGNSVYYFSDDEVDTICFYSSL